MTNKEKAIQLATDSKGNIQAFAYMAAFEMVEWKDSQFLEFLENEKISHPLIYRDDWKSHENDIYHKFLDELINKFKTIKNESI